mgnify:CR=1 FL=1
MIFQEEHEHMNGKARLLGGVRARRAERIPGPAERDEQSLARHMRSLAVQLRVNGRARCEEMCTRITLTGMTPLHAVLARPGVLEDLRANINDSYMAFFCDALVDQTTCPRDVEALRREGLFPAVFLQASEAVRSDRDEAIAYVQEEFLKKNIQLPSAYAKRIDRLAEEAESLVLDLLSRGEDK